MACTCPTTVDTTQAAAALAALQSERAAAGAPYPPLNWSLGSPPSILPDVPLSAIFALLFLALGIKNMKLFMANKARGAPSGVSLAQFIFCPIRVFSAFFRLLWAIQPQNGHLALAAMIFLYVPPILLFVVNLILAARLMRARQPRIGWSRLFTAAIWQIPLVIVTSNIVMIVFSQTAAAYTFNPVTVHQGRSIMLFVLTSFLVISGLPIFWIAIMFLVPRRTNTANFGIGSFEVKLGLVLVSSLLMVLSAGFNAGTDWMPQVPLIYSQPVYFKKIFFYLFIFTIEVTVLFMNLKARIDGRFRVPAGAKWPGGYAIASAAERAAQKKKEWPEDMYKSATSGKSAVSVSEPWGMGKGAVLEYVYDVDDSQSSVGSLSDSSSEVTQYYPQPGPAKLRPVSGMSTEGKIKAWDGMVLHWV